MTTTVMLLALACWAQAAAPALNVEFTSQGELSLTLDGKPISISEPAKTLRLGTVRFRDPAATVPLLGADDKLWPVDGADSQPRTNVFDAARRQLTQTFAWGTVVRTYRVVPGGVNIEVTVHNQSAKTLCEFRQRLFTLKLPGDTGPADTTEALYFGQVIPAQSGDTLSGPVALPLVGGACFADNRGKGSAAIVATTPETKHQLALSWQSDSWIEPWNRKPKLTGYAVNDPVAMELALRQQEEERAAKGETWWLTLSVGGDRQLYHDRYTSRPIPPGGSDTYSVWLRFGDSSDPLAPAKEALQAYGKAHPMRFQWKDRRPIVPTMLGDSFPFHEPEAATLTKPKGVTSTPEFRDRMLKAADGLIAQMKAIDAQGVIVWNIEGNGPDYMKYVGDPHMVEFMCPEADAVADEFFKKIRDAGFKVGVCLRPSVIAVGDTAKDPGLKAAFPGAKSAFAYYHDYPHATRSPADILSEKVAYAKKRWGCTLFYVDTNIAGGMRQKPDGSWFFYSALLNEDVWAEVLKRHPDVLFTIEHTPLIQYTVSAPYDEWQGGNGTPPVVRATWPEAFKCIVVKEPKDHWQVAARVRDGDVLACGGETAALLNRLGATLRLGPPKELAGMTPDRWLATATDPAATEQMRFFAAKQLCAGEVNAATVDKLLTGSDRLVQMLAVESLKTRDQIKAQIPRLIKLPGGQYGFFGGPLRDAIQRGGPEVLLDLADYARRNPNDGPAIVNMLFVIPGTGAIEQLAALVTDTTLPESLRHYATESLGWRKDATAAQKDTALGYLFPMLSDAKQRMYAAYTLHRHYYHAHGLWANDPRVLAAAKAALAAEQAKPQPDKAFVAALEKIVNRLP